MTPERVCGIGECAEKHHANGLDTAAGRICWGGIEIERKSPSPNTMAAAG